MILNKLKQENAEKWLRYFIAAIIALGILLRIVVYLQCNSMYIDEANIARNVYERNFSQLTSPLSYEQYAPPVFLWIVKLSTLAFGYSEYAYRLYPLFCGIISLILMYEVLKHFASGAGIWYVILLLATGSIYVRYTCGTKQYMPDMLITITLIWLALRNTIASTSALRLLLLWALAGSLAIWSSMPSVFILAGIGFYYFSTMVKLKDFRKLWFLFLCVVIWLVQFAFYYIVILKPEANSNYLQNFHKDYFFYLPVSLNILFQDLNLLLDFISTAGGFHVLALVLNIGCILIGIAYLARRNVTQLLLLTVPLLAVLLTAALHQYSLIPRLTLFAMPLLLILIAIGLDRIMKLQFIVIRLALIICSFICFINFNCLKNFIQPMQIEDIKSSLLYLKSKNIRGNQLYIHHLAVPGFVYYTQINPAKNDFSMLMGASILKWNTNCDSLAQTFPNRSAMLYNWDTENSIMAQQNAIRRHVSVTDSNFVKDGRVYIYRKNGTL